MPVGSPRHAIAALAAAAFLAAGPGPAAAQGQQPQLGGTLTVAFASDTKTLDPTFSVNFSERQPLYLLYNTLVALKPDLTMAPELAERWEISGDGLRLTLHLRRGVKFHDGTDFDAQAVKFNLDRRMDAAVGSPQRAQLGAIIASVEAPDASTVVINMKQPSPSLLGMLAQREGFMASPAAIGRFGKDFATNPVGTGPFTLKEWTPGQRIVVEKNRAYWEAGKPYLDSVVFADITNTVVGVQRLITGEADYASALSPIDIRQIENRREIKLDPSAVGRWYGLQWQVDKPPFDNAKLRQAIAHAIDRKRIVDIVMNGRAPVAEGLTPPALWWHDPTLRGPAHDPARARALLAEAGYPNGLQLTLSNPQINLLQQMNQLVQEQLKAIGIDVRLEPVAQSDWYPRLVQGAINFSPIRWSQRPDPDGLFTILLQSNGFANSTKYKNPELDALLAQARNATSVEARKALYSAVERKMIEDLPYVSLFFSAEYAAMRSNVMNHVWIGDEIPRFREMWKARN
ncbi:MAG: ABC transporter substrate-binding protein [Thalassobaculales bacterium]